MKMDPVTILGIPAWTIVDVDPKSGKMRFTEPNGCRYVLKHIKGTINVPASVTWSVRA